MNFGQWNHVTAVYDYDNTTAKLYFNGSPLVSGEFGAFLGGLVDATIGKRDVTFDSQ
jgi:hypothetical protein